MFWEVVLVSLDGIKWGKEFPKALLNQQIFIH